MLAERSSLRSKAAMPPAAKVREDPALVRWGLTLFVVAVIGLLVVVPVVNVFYVALSNGGGAYWRNLLDDPDTRHAIMLTLRVVGVVLVLNTIFGIAAAWALTRFSFPGRTLLTALIDLPFAVSPVVAGLVFVLIFGLQGYFGAFLRRDGYSIMPYIMSFLGAFVFVALYSMLRPSGRDAGRRLWSRPFLVVPTGAILVFGTLFFLQQYLGVWPEHKSLKIIFAYPGLVLATAFVTVPFVARELMPIMEEVGPEEELAALSLGANGRQMFWHVTIPNVKWGLVYGIILCNARAMGEFGAVYVVSGHVAGQTDTMPLRIEKLFQEFNLEGAYAVASLLTVVAIITLVVKALLERTASTERAQPEPTPGDEA